nr:capsid triplex subunit 2 [Macronycteris gammaherpesvirus 1]
MQVDNRIVVTLTCRLYADEISKLQEKVGCILPLQDSHKLQNLNSVGLTTVCQRNVAPDFIQIYSYLSRATLAILEEVTPDSLIFSRIDYSQNYQLKNVYSPFFQWDSHTPLAVIPPVFGIEKSTIVLESNGFDLVFPSVVPLDLGQIVIQKLFLYNVYAKLHEDNVGDINMEHVHLQTTTIHHMGRTYALDIAPNNPESILEIMDNLVMYSSILMYMVPQAIQRLFPVILRHNQHELLDLFIGDNQVDDQFHANIDDDIPKMEAFMACLHSLSTVFNLGPKLRLAQYSSETLCGTAWLTP